jgi:long-chain acyl-CoA synthetase
MTSVTLQPATQLTDSSYTLSLPNSLSALFFSYPQDQLLVAEGDQRFTAGELQEKALSLAHTWRHEHGLQPGERVALCLSNQWEWLVAFFAARLLGVVPTPVNLQLGVEGLLYLLQDARVSLLVVDASLIAQMLSNASSLQQLAASGSKLPWPVMATRVSPEMDGTLAHLFSAVSHFEAAVATPLAAADREALLSASRRDAPDTGLSLLLYTSGSTGAAKGVQLSEANLLANLDGFTRVLQFPAEDQLMMLALPLFHGFGLICLLYALALKAPVVLAPKFQPKALLQALLSHPVTILPLVPTFFSLLLEAGRTMLRGVSAGAGTNTGEVSKPFPSLRYCISGGATLPPALLDKVEATFGVEVLEGYGLTETSPVVAVNTPLQGRVPGSVGRVLPNMQVAIAPLSTPDAREAFTGTETGEGEILLKGPNVFLGYLNQVEASQASFTQDGWFRTGDLGRFDARGNLYISGGRIKDLIIKSGENLAPVKIEQVLMAYDDALEVAVIGKPDERLGEVVLACVALKSGVPSPEATAAAAKAIRQHCQQHLPPLYLPDEVLFFEGLPKTPTGKIAKPDLRRQVLG